MCHHQRGPALVFDLDFKDKSPFLWVISTKCKLWDSWECHPNRHEKAKPFSCLTFCRIESMFLVRFEGIIVMWKKVDNVYKYVWRSSLSRPLTSLTFLFLNFSVSSFSWPLADAKLSPAWTSSGVWPKFWRQIPFCDLSLANTSYGSPETVVVVGLTISSKTLVLSNFLSIRNYDSC